MLNGIAQATGIRVKVFGKRLLHWPAPTFPIEFYSTVPRAQLFEEYRRADVLVHATLADAFGLTVTEAMSQGLPVTTRGRVFPNSSIPDGRASSYRRQTPTHSHRRCAGASLIAILSVKSGLPGNVPLRHGNGTTTARRLPAYLPGLFPNIVLSPDQR